MFWVFLFFAILLMIGISLGILVLSDFLPVGNILLFYGLESVWGSFWFVVL